MNPLKCCLCLKPSNEFPEYFKTVLTDFIQLFNKFQSCSFNNVKVNKLTLCKSCWIYFMRTHQLDHELRLKKETFDAKKSFLSSKIRQSQRLLVGKGNKAASCEDFQVQSSASKDNDDNDSIASVQTLGWDPAEAISCSVNNSDESDNESLQSCKTDKVFTTENVSVSAKSAEENPTAAATDDTSTMESKSEPAKRKELIDKAATSASSPEKEPTVGTPDEASDNKSEPEPAKHKTLNDNGSNSESSPEEDQLEVTSDDSSGSDFEPDKKEDPTEVISVDTSDSVSESDSEPEKARRLRSRSKRLSKTTKRSYEKGIQSSDIEKLSETDFIYMNKYPFTRTDAGLKCGLCSAVSTFYNRASCDSYNMLRHIHNWHISNHRVRPTRFPQRFIEIAPNRFQYGNYKVEFIDGNYRCEECGELRAESPGPKKTANIIEHIRKHHESDHQGRETKVRQRLIEIAPNRFQYGNYKVEFIDGKYRCEECSKVRAERKGIMEHIKNHHESPSRSFPCGYCCKIYRTASRLSEHKIKSNHTTNINPFFIDRVTFTYENKWLPKNITLPKSSQIVKQTSDTDFLYMGKYPFQGTEFGFKCGLCRVVSSFTVLDRQAPWVNLGHHIKKWHMGDPDRSKVKNLTQRCIQVGPDRFQYGKTSFEMVDGMYQCGACGVFKILSRSGHDKTKNIIQHILRHHNEKISREFVCEYCGVVYNNRGSLRSHRQVKHESGQFPCSECGKNFPSRASVKHHERQVHLKRRDFMCENCGKKFSQKAGLEIHVASVHRQEKMPCEECGKMFGSQAALNVHLNSSHKGKKYSCDICGMDFTQGYSVIRHKKTAHDA